MYTTAGQQRTKKNNRIDNSKTSPGTYHIHYAHNLFFICNAKKKMPRKERHSDLLKVMILMIILLFLSVISFEYYDLSYIQIWNFASNLHSH